MKKYIFILVFAMVAMAVQAQTFTGKVSVNNTYTAASLSSFSLTNTDTVDVVVTLNSHTPFTLDAGIALDSISGNPTGTLYVLGRKASTEAWSTIANQAWTSTNDGTVIVSHTTPVRYRQLLLRFINGGTGVTEADSYWVKLWSE